MQNGKYMEQHFKVLLQDPTKNSSFDKKQIDSSEWKQWRSEEGQITISCCCWLDMIPNTIWYEKFQKMRENWDKKVTWWKLSHTEEEFWVDEVSDYFDCKTLEIVFFT